MKTSTNGSATAIDFNSTKSRLRSDTRKPQGHPSHVEWSFLSPTDGDSRGRIGASVSGTSKVAGPMGRLIARMRDAERGIVARIKQMHTGGVNHVSQSKAAASTKG